MGWIPGERPLSSFRNSVLWNHGIDTPQTSGTGIHEVYNRSHE